MAIITATMTLPVNETQSQKPEERTRTTEAANVRVIGTDWLGKPYRVGKDDTKEEGIEKHRVYFYIKLDTYAEFKRRVSGLRRQRIGCPGNCKPGPCHLEVIVDYVNNLASITTTTMAMTTVNKAKSQTWPKLTWKATVLCFLLTRRL